MKFSKPISFEPIIMERVWGGGRLRDFNKSLPDSEGFYGESWELVDRPEAQSVVTGGALGGKKLSELWGDLETRSAVFGEGAPSTQRFPILVKILDCRQKLSVQVHPPAEIAESLAGEPKTEMWQIVEADDDASLYVGLKNGASKDDFSSAVKEGTTEDLIHSIRPSVGESIFIPSGRLHAIGGGLVIYEIQQNSDTTFRVFDWNRSGLDGKPRQLHVEESLKCIDFDDIEPEMDPQDGESRADCPHFRVDHWKLSEGESKEAASAGEFAYFGVAEGKVSCGGEVFRKGEFFLVPASREDDCGKLFSVGAPAEVVRTRFGVAEIGKCA